MRHKYIALIVIAVIIQLLGVDQHLLAQPGPFKMENGVVHFKSDAPLETIEAESKVLRGAIDPVKNTFAFTIDISSFDGFNSALQKVHFNENYLESKTFPRSFFVGKIIENIDWNTEGTFSVRAKGILTVHGQEKERIIKSTVRISPDKLHITSNFTIMLKDYNIAIPKIVSQKIASEIMVSINADFERPDIK